MLKLCTPQHVRYSHCTTNCERIQEKLPKYGNAHALKTLMTHCPEGTIYISPGFLTLGKNTKNHIRSEGATYKKAPPFPARAI